ncbi:hypothetical protein NQ318_004321 [Aromia moschata]|uniref:Chitin-binding type-2 domain-containing protein n=1 Tax=Aromia moschata TaxID=1265417 RepID=A0AAV8YQT5_9CUCU|nr:hypothetical protein NQ318_004321 [Aromia moschata]
MAYIAVILASVALLAQLASPSAVNVRPAVFSDNVDPFCPYPSPVTTYYPNTEDCHQFFECYEGRKYTLVCNDNLLWNQEKLECDYPQNVNCNRSDNVCENERDGTYLANPDDCSSFFECVDHKAIGAKCSPGTVWNQAVLNCDFPSNVNCASNSK